MSKLAWRMAWLTSAFAVVVACGSQAVEFPGASGGPATGGLSCVKANQCPGTQGCVNGTCAACTDATNCMPGQSCTGGQCGGCTTNAQCAAGQACVNGACGGCTSGDQCTEGKACVNGQCVGCTSNAQCLQGKVCVNGSCVCSTNAQCPGGQECSAGVCVVPGGGGCTTGDQCVDGKTCVNSQCGPCTTNAQCLEGKVCVNGSCACASNAQCPSTQSCTGGVCKTGGSDGGPLTDAADAADACTGKPVYQNFFPNVTSMWASNGKVGVAAGDDMCKTIGADHFCDYAEIKAAQAKNELAGLGNMTFWVHRTTSELVGGVANGGGAGARCADWTYATNHINNAEFGTVAAGAITYDLAPADKITVNTSPATGTARLCGTVSRNILCCHPKCP